MGWYSNIKKKGHAVHHTYNDNEVLVSFTDNCELLRIR